MNRKPNTGGARRRTLRVIAGAALALAAGPGVGA
ncbi:hypothetical protein B1M_17275, partial [Burkholderia sp. TJI49]